MIRSILYLLRIGPGWDVEDGDGMPGKDFGPNWIRGLFLSMSNIPRRLSQSSRSTRGAKLPGLFTDHTHNGRGNGRGNDDD